MPDACDFITDVQLKAAEDFSAARLGSLVLQVPSSASYCPCGAPISAARRAAVPGVKRCTICQARAERGAYVRA